MRGGVARWKRGVGGSGIASGVAYAFGGACDTGYLDDAGHTQGTINAARYAAAVVDRFTVTDDGIAVDVLDVDQLQTWFSGADPETGERRGRDLASPTTDLVLDATINAPKSFSLAGVLDPEIAAGYDALQDRLRDRIITMWKDELNARRGAGGRHREDLARIEVVELRHERSRALDAHKHRHLWLNAKVLGRDGQWSSVDSRVMMRFQNIVNAEGDLAARTDPEWIALLAAKGYTIDEDGEIAQLAGLVRPLSRRANQIEANRTARLAEWYEEHPGQEPGHDVLMAIDRWAWAHNRPDKPDHVDEGEWLDTVRREIADIDPAIVVGHDRSPIVPTAMAIADIDREGLAAVTVADADRRASATGGRFSAFDLRAGAVRAVAASGVVADRAALTELVEDVTARATEASTLSMLDEDEIPGHVKHLMSTATVSAKLALAAKFDSMTGAGHVVDEQAVTSVAGQVLGGATLDVGQSDAAGAIGGTDRLVTVTGPAGTGKTTMLRVARTLLENQNRRMIVVAPTKKAASVAGQEVGAKASSLHALLLDHGFRWADSPAGQIWTRLVPGEQDPATGTVYDGPRKYTLQPGDRIVVDEAGMVDLHTANALADVAKDTGAGIAMVGDHLQALPVGHSGAMSLMRTRSGSVVELTAVHRFMTTGPDGKPTKDTAWADLSLRIREPGRDVAAVAHEIVETGHAVLVATDAEARHHMVEEWLAGHQQRQRVALVTATHDEAMAISETIQARRVRAGQLDTSRSIAMQRGQSGYVGDVIQTRRNDTTQDVENRQLWTIGQISKNGTTVQLVSVDDPGVTREVSTGYLAEHAHLAYASTVHGVQGETTHRSLVGPGVDAAGLYVGLTRGRTHNAAILVADSAVDARKQLVETMQRGQIEASIEDARAAARADLAHVARTPHLPVVDDRPAPWHDRAARPLGRVVRLDELLASTLEQEKSLQEQSARLSDKIAHDQEALNEINVKISTWAARDHAEQVAGADPKPAPLLLPAKDTLTARLAAARAERAQLTAAYRKITKQLDAATREAAIRAELGPDVNAYENDARRRSIQTRRPAEIPAWNDRQHRPLGKVAALRAKGIAAITEARELAAERDERARTIAAVQDRLRAEAGPDGIELTAEQRARATALLKAATASYDQVVERHAQITKLIRAVEREQTFRDDLAAAAAARAERIEELRSTLGDVQEQLTDAERARLVDELQELSTTIDRASQEDRARRAALTDPDDSRPQGPAPAADRGPALR